MQDGAIYTHHQHTRHGDPDEPLTDQELLDKFNELTEPRIGMEQAQILAEQILTKSMPVRNLSQSWS